MSDIYEATRAACADVGIIYRDVPADGEFHQTDVEGDRRGKGDGRIKIFRDMQGGIVCNWKGEQKPFFVDRDRKPTEAELRQRTESMKRVEAERLKRQDEARQQAAELWKSGLPVESHPYLETKGIGAHGIKQFAGPMTLNGVCVTGALMLPIRDSSGLLHSLEFITTTGEKRFLSGGLIAGNYHGIGKPADCLVIAEGYATGASIYEATGHAVAVAFFAGNLEPVARALRKKYPDMRIVIAADNDQWTEGNPGVTKARDAAEEVGGFLCVPQFQDVSSKPTDFNDLHKLQGLDAVTEAFNNIEQPVTDGGSVSFVSSEVWPNFEPLPELPPVLPLNMNALPDVLRDLIADVTDRMQCPPDFTAAACLAMVSSAIGRQISIRPKKVDNWTVVPNLWAMIVGRSGVMKSPSMSHALAPLRRMQTEAFKVQEEAMRDYKVSAQVAKIQAEDAQTKARRLLKEGNTIAAQTLLATTQGESDEPTVRRYIVNDSTVEALAETLEENPNGVLVDRDELAGWLKSLDKEGQQEARAFYLVAADGDKGFTTDRITRGRGRHIPAVCVSIVGGIQPGVLAHYVRDTQRQGSGDDGLLQRFGIMVYPDITRDWHNVDREPNKRALAAVHDLVSRLCAIDPAAIGAQMDPHDPIPFLRFDSAAQALFDDWRSELEHRLRSDDDHPAIISHLSKYRKLVPSLALIDHLCAAGTGQVSENSLARALQLAVYLESHARRVYSHASRPDVAAAKSILAKIRGGKLPRIFAIRDVYRPQWSGLCTAEEVRPAVKLLAEFGYLREVHKEDRNGRPTEQYEAHPDIGGAS